MWGRGDEGGERDKRGEREQTTTETTASQVKMWENQLVEMDPCTNARILPRVACSRMGQRHMCVCVSVIAFRVWRLWGSGFWRLGFTVQG